MTVSKINVLKLDQKRRINLLHPRLGSIHCVYVQVHAGVYLFLAFLIFHGNK